MSLSDFPSTTLFLLGGSGKAMDILELAKEVDLAIHLVCG